MCNNKEKKNLKNTDAGRNNCTPQNDYFGDQMNRKQTKASDKLKPLRDPLSKVT